MKFFSNFKESIIRTANSVIFSAKKNSPTILLIGGITCVVAGTVSAIHATSKADEVLDNFHKDLEKIDEIVEKAEANNKTDIYPVEQANKDRKIVYGHMVMSMAKIYLPTVLLETVGIGMICKSHSILSKRNAGLAVAYAGLSKAFNDYRQRVSDKYGAEEENRLYYGMEDHTITVKEISENGVVTEKEEIVTSLDPVNDSLSAFIDELSGIWCKDSPSSTKNNILVQQRMLNENLRRRKFITLNEAYRALDLPETPDGMVLGWYYDPNVIDKIDFGLFTRNDMATRRFVNGYEDVVLVTFNVDGNIFNLRSKNDREIMLNDPSISSKESTKALLGKTYKKG